MANAADKFAQEYGYQLAFLKSDPELYSIFQKAMKGQWDSTKFVAAVKNSAWYKTHSDSYRASLAEKTTNPGTWAQKIASERARLAGIAHTMGAPVPGAIMEKLTNDATMMGWSDQQIRDAMAKYIKTNPGSWGEAGQTRQALQQTAFRNGVNVSQNYIDQQARLVATGAISIQDAQQQLRSQYGKSIAPGFAKEIDGGQDLYDLAAPYMQTMASTLELNPSDVDLFDPTIRKALGSSVDEKGKPTPGSTPLWQFEQQLRQDGRFMKTKQAQDQTMAVGHSVLRDMGLVS